MHVNKVTYLSRAPQKVCLYIVQSSRSLYCTNNVRFDAASHVTSGDHPSLSQWLTQSRRAWIFQGMLTAMKQEVTRKHKAEKWALDDVVYHTEVTSYERMEQVRCACIRLWRGTTMPFSQRSSEESGSLARRLWIQSNLPSFTTCFVPQ